MSDAPGITVPSAEQKQSGRTQSARLHLGALLVRNTVETANFEYFYLRLNKEVKR